MELKLETYVHPSLEIELPIEIRKQVYEKAIELVLVDNIFDQNGHNHLCFTLPIILLNRNSWVGVGNIHDNYIAFPELNEKRIRLIESNYKLGKLRLNQFRKQILQEMLNELNTNRL